VRKEREEQMALTAWEKKKKEKAPAEVEGRGAAGAGSQPAAEHGTPGRLALARAALSGAKQTC